MPVGLAGIPLVAHHRAWLSIGTERKQDGKVRRVGLLATGQVESDRMAVKVCFQMDFRREPAARAAERLVLLPPLWMARPSRRHLCRMLVFKKGRNGP